MSRRVPIAAMIALAVAPALSGCGERKVALAPVAPVALRIAGPSGAGASPLDAAERTGGLREAGLNVSTTIVPSGRAAIDAVTSGRADIALASAPDVLEARDRGARVVAVAAVAQRPITVLVGLRTGSLGDLAALITKPIGTSGADYERAFAQTIFKRAQVRVAPYGADAAAALASKRFVTVLADAAVPNARALRGRKLSAQPVDQLGVPRFDGAVLVVSEASRTRLGDPIRSLVGALARATSGLRAGKPGPVSGLARVVPGGDPAGLAKALPPLLGGPPPGRPYGWQQPADWQALGSWMRSRGLAKPDPAAAFTNAYLPGGAAK